MSWVGPVTARARDVTKILNREVRHFGPVSANPQVCLGWTRR